jgi:hypothetical protein
VKSPIEAAGLELAATVTRVHETVADLLGQVHAIRDAATGPEVGNRAKVAAAARAGGIRDAAAQIQEALRRKS